MSSVFTIHHYDLMQILEPGVFTYWKNCGSCTPFCKENDFDLYISSKKP